MRAKKLQNNICHIIYCIPLSFKTFVSQYCVKIPQLGSLQLGKQEKYTKIDNYCCAQEASQKFMSSNHLQQDLKKIVKLLLWVQIIAVGDGGLGWLQPP